jgi:hypothetical protein
MSSIKTPLTHEIIESIKKQYAYIIVDDIKRINDPNNINIAPKIISEIQEKLNKYARELFDKYGRIIIRVGPHQFDYLDITSPRVKLSQTEALVYFLETDKKGKPAKNPQEL